MNCLSSDSDQKMDFSIFNGQNVQRKPANIHLKDHFQGRRQANAFQEHNLGSNSKHNTYVERQNFRQSEQFQQPRPVKNASVFSVPKSPQVFEGNHNVKKSSNALGLMEVSKPNECSPQMQNNTSSFLDTSKLKDMSQSTCKGSPSMKRYGETNPERMCIFTGTVERVIRWGKIFQNHFCYYEVIAAVLSITNGKVQFERIMLLKDKKGPILQVTYYFNSTHMNIEDFHLGQMLRVVGRMIGPNIMSAITMRAAMKEEIENLTRMCYVCDQAVSTLCGNN